MTPTLHCCKTPDPLSRSSIYEAGSCGGASPQRPRAQSLGEEISLRGFGFGEWLYCSDLGSVIAVSATIASPCYLVPVSLPVMTGLGFRVK